MVESDKKLIFILPPGMKKLIKQQASKDETYRMIKSAIEVV